ALAFKPLSIQAVALPPQARHPALQPWVLTDHLEAAEKQIAEAKENFEKAREKFANAESSAATYETTHALEDAKSKPVEAGSPIERARFELALAETTLAAAQLRPAMLRAVWEADALRFADTNVAGDLPARIKVAAAAEAKFKLAQCEANLTS